MSKDNSTLLNTHTYPFNYSREKIIKEDMHSKMGLTNNHISLYNTDSVRELCTPLFSKTDLNYFHYAKMYDSGHCSVLVTNPEYHRHFWDKKYNEAIFPNYAPGVFFNNPCSTEGMRDARDCYNIDNMLMIIKPKLDHLEIFGFATHSSNDKILSFYLNNLDILEKFGFYFKAAAQDLITIADKNLIYTENYKEKSLRSKTNKKMENLNMDFFDESHTKKFEIDLGGYYAALTLKEIKIIQLLSKGKSTKDIADQLHRSPRTVESHVENIKTKLRCYKKTKLIEICQRIFESNPLLT